VAVGAGERSDGDLCVEDEAADDDELEHEEEQEEAEGGQSARDTRDQRDQLRRLGSDAEQPLPPQCECPWTICQRDRGDRFTSSRRHEQDLSQDDVGRHDERRALAQHDKAKAHERIDIDVPRNEDPCEGQKEDDPSKFLSFLGELASRRRRLSGVGDDSFHRRCSTMRLIRVIGRDL